MEEDEEEDTVSLVAPGLSGRCHFRRGERHGRLYLGGKLRVHLTGQVHRSGQGIHLLLQQDDANMKGK